VQDPYSLRCAPQVHGAVRDALNYVAGVLEREMNSVTDNPLLFPADSVILNGGNFHAEPVALAADFAAIALSELANISERRIENMVNPDLSGLPAFLAPDPGLNSGFMIAQVSAAAIVSENKTLAHPASVDSIPTSAGKEDHVSMATWAGRKLGMIVVERRTRPRDRTALRRPSARPAAQAVARTRQRCRRRISSDPQAREADAARSRSRAGHRSDPSLDHVWRGRGCRAERRGQAGLNPFHVTNSNARRARALMIPTLPSLERSNPQESP
jgi:hypothetical protein